MWVYRRRRKNWLTRWKINCWLKLTFAHSLMSCLLKIINLTVKDQITVKLAKSHSSLHHLSKTHPNNSPTSLYNLNSLKKRSLDLYLRTLTTGTELATSQLTTGTLWKILTCSKLKTKMASKSSSMIHIIDEHKNLIPSPRKAKNKTWCCRLPL